MTEVRYRPLCFVLMPFGIKPDGTGRTIDFDQVYRSILAPAIDKAGLDPIRADEEGVGGSIHKPMFERLMICDFAIADLTTSNANVYYELGIRHAFRPHSTTITFHDGCVLPFDVHMIRGIPYRMNDVETSIAALGERLAEGRKRQKDSPIYQLIDGIPPYKFDPDKAEAFRDRVQKSKGYQERLIQARSLGREPGREAILAVRSELGNLEDVESNVIVELFFSLRAVSAGAEMIALYDEMPDFLQENRQIREQYAAQLNRASRRGEAEKLLKEIIGTNPSPETNGLLGRVYKDLYLDARHAGRPIEARGYLKDAIGFYLQGFESDWRDPYPGINAVTLMEGLDKPDPRQTTLIPIVRYAAERRVAKTGGGDYWDHAVLLELAVLARDQDDAFAHLEVVMVRAKQPGQREIFKPETTANNLRLIEGWRVAKGVTETWLGDIIKELERVAADLTEGK